MVLPCLFSELMFMASGRTRAIFTPTPASAFSFSFVLCQFYYNKDNDCQYDDTDYNRGKVFSQKCKQNQFLLFTV